MKAEFKNKICKQLKAQIQEKRQLNLFNWVAFCHKVLSVDLENYFDEENWEECQQPESVSEVIALIIPQTLLHYR